MSGASITLQQADGTDLSYVETLLDGNGLPSQDVRSKPECFYVGYDGDERVGIGGLEIYETDGLLRSLVVEESARGRGFGTVLCEALEARDRADGVETLHLLTTTASAFFAGRGYEEIEHGDASTTVRQTAEFDDLCPITATCMEKSVSR